MASTTIALLILVSVQSACGQLLGGWSEANTTSKDVLDAAKNGLKLYEGPDANRILLLDVLNASQQVTISVICASYKCLLSMANESTNNQLL